MRDQSYYRLEQLRQHMPATVGAVIVVATFFLAMVLAYGPARSAPKSIILTLGDNRQQFAGATATEEGLLIQPLNRVIAHQDGSLGQPNPPVNLAGPHFSVSGDFRITARMEKIDMRGTIRFYGSPPIVYDQWRFETASIAVEVATSTIVVRIWDGSSSSHIDMRTYPFTLKKTTNVSIEQKKDTFVISANKQVLGAIPDHRIFDGKEVWFGADAALADDWLLRSLTIEALQNGNVGIIARSSFEIPHDDPNALRNLAEKHPRKLRIGTAVAYGALVTDQEYRKLAMGEFNMVTPENGLKPQFIHPQQDDYVFSEMDELIDIALNNDMLVHGHALVYAKSNPEWMSEAPKA